MIRSLCLIAFLISVSAFAKKETIKKVESVNVHSLADLMSIYRTYDDQFAMLVSLKMVTADEVTAVKSFLKTKNVDLEATAGIPIFEGDKVRWGTTELTYSKTENSYKTKAGFFLRKKSGETFDQTFARFYNAIESKCTNCTSKFQVFLPNANAKDHMDSLELEISHNPTVNAALYSASMTIGSVAFCTGAAAQSFVGGLGTSLKLVLYPFRKLIYDGKVTCDSNGRFVVKEVSLNIIDPTRSRLNLSDRSLPTKCYEFGQTMGSNLMTVFEDDIAEQDCQNKNDSELSCNARVSKDVLKWAFGDNVPKCSLTDRLTADNIKRIEERIKAKAIAEEEGYLAQMATNAIEQKKKASDKSKATEKVSR